MYPHRLFVVENLAFHWWHRLSVRLSLGVAGLFAILTVAIAVALLALMSSYRALEEVGRLTSAEREAAAIGVAAREQYIHETHAVLTGDDVHLEHDRLWAAELGTRVSRLRPLVIHAEQALLDKVQSDSLALGETFTHQILPASRSGDLARVRLSHAHALELMDSMIATSNRVASVLIARNVARAASALARARIAGMVAGVTFLVAASCAVLLGVTQVHRIVYPLASLNETAARIGQGDFGAVAPPMRVTEFEELGRALESMARGLHEREVRLLKAERLAGVGRLAAGVAHEINNPLGVIIGYLKTLHTAQVDPDVREDLRIVEEEAHQCRRIVEDLLAFAREPVLERKLTRLRAVADDVTARLARAGELRGRNVTVHGDGSFEAFADPTRIAQALRNLVLNAIAASPIDGEIRVQVTCDASGDAILRVVDEGVGVSPRDLPRLFEPFFGRRGGGTGLGLAVSHGLVTAHGGTIEIASIEGEGTTVTVTLPPRSDAFVGAADSLVREGAQS